MKRNFIFFIVLATHFLSAQVGIGTTDPGALLDIPASNLATPSATDGILIPRLSTFPAVNPSAAQNGMMVFLTNDITDYSKGFHYWDHPNTRWNKVGSGAPRTYTAIGTTNIVAASAQQPMAQMIQTLTPRSSVVMVEFSAGGYNTANTCAEFGIFFVLLLNGSPVKTFHSSAENIQNGGRPIWHAKFTYPVTVTEGVAQTISINWFTPSCNAIANQVNIPYQNSQAHRVLNIIDYEGGGGISASPITQGYFWSATGNSGMANGNFLGTLDDIDLNLRRNNLPAGKLAASNTSFGVQAMPSLGSTAAGNVAIGTNAIRTSTSGSGNTAVGHSALINNNFGGGNVALGFNAGYSETGSNKLYIHNNGSLSPLIYGEFDNALLRANGTLQVKNPVSTDPVAQVTNRNVYSHLGDTNLNFGNGLGYAMLSTQQGASNETGGLFADGNALAFWSPGDGNLGQPAAIAYFLDEDFWTDNNGNPYDNGAMRSYIAASGAYVQVSDITKKEDIRPIPNALEKISKIGGYTYKFKLAPEEIAKGDKPKSNSGVLAQEVESIFPEAVQKSEQGDYYVDYAALTPVLIEAMKEQNQLIETLKMQHLEQQKINDKLLKRLDALEK